MKLIEILNNAKKNSWAIPAIDVVNYEMVVAAIKAASIEKSPIVLLIHPYLVPQVQWDSLVAMIRKESEKYDVPVFIQLDHGSKMEEVIKAVELAFDAVMIDGGNLTFSENLELTRSVMELVKGKDIVVEGTLGYIGFGNENLSNEEYKSRLAKVEEVEEYVKQTNIDILAVALGNAHGAYKDEPSIDIDLLQKLSSKTDKPFVFHGGSYSPEREITEAISNGVCKVNFWTEIAKVFSQSLKESETDGQINLQILSNLENTKIAIQGVIQNKIQMLGAANRA